MFRDTSISLYILYYLVHIGNLVFVFCKNSFCRRGSGIPSDSAEAAAGAILFDRAAADVAVVARIRRLVRPGERLPQDRFRGQPRRAARRQLARGSLRLHLRLHLISLTRVSPK